MRTNALKCDYEEFQALLSLQMSLIFEIGITTALRISDILNLKIKCLSYKKFTIKEKKTGKKREIIFHPLLRTKLKEYCQGRDLNSYIFESAKKPGKPITRQSVWKAYKRVAKRLELKYNVGTHSMRHSKARDLYLETKDIEQVKKLLNHGDFNSVATYLFE